MTTELKACPFCHEDDVQVQPYRSGFIQYSVRCLGCGARGPVDDHDDCIQKWNNRGEHSQEVERG